MSYAEIDDNIISDGSVVTEPSSGAQAAPEETPYYQQYQEQPEPYGDTPLPDYQYQTKRSTVNDYYELGFFTKITGFAGFAFLCIGLIIYLSGFASLGLSVNWLQLLGTILPMCLAIFILLDKIAYAYNAILVLMLLSLNTGVVAFFDMISYASANGGSKMNAAAAGEFFVFFGHALMIVSSFLSFKGK